MVNLDEAPQTLSWPTAEPASVGLDAELLNEAWSVLAERSTQALLVLRRGTLVFERYRRGWRRRQTTLHSIDGQGPRGRIVSGSCYR